MKRIMILLLLCSTLTTFAQKTSFSGNWKINKTKTDFGKAPEFVLPRSIKIEQSVDKILISEIQLDNDLNELPAFVQNLTFDGKPTVSKQPLNRPYVTSSLHWSNDKSFIINLKGTSTAIENWILEDSGKTLVIDRSVEQSNGNKYTIKAYYDKVN